MTTGGHADFFQQFFRVNIFRIHHGHQFAQVHSLEGVSEHRGRGLGGKAFAPVFARQAVKQLRVGMTVEWREADPADELII